MVGTVLLILLVLLFVGGLPLWSYSKDWGYNPASLIALILVIYLILILIGRVPLA